MYSTLYLLKYNNFFNKIVRKEPTLEDYQDYVIGLPLQRINFIPNDYLDTIQIINWNYELPDYLLVVNEEGEIDSRWYITQATRTRAGQLELALRRDVLADYRDEVLNSTAYIRRALLPISNPLIYNSEGMSFNQIKSSEIQLFDKTGKAWIVGYVAPNADLKSASIIFENDGAPLTNYQELVALSANSQKVVINVPSIDINTISPRISGSIPANSKYNLATYHIAPDNPTVVTNVTEIGQSGHPCWQQDIVESGPVSTEFDRVFAGKTPLLKQYIAGYYDNVSEASDFSKYNGKIVLDQTTGTYYKVNVLQKSTQNYRELVRKVDGATNNLFEQLKALILQNSHITASTLTRYDLYINYTAAEYQLQLTPISYGDYNISFTMDKRILHDAPYHMFCMPYTEQNYMLAIQIGIQNGVNIYDIQLLPYCPVQDYYDIQGVPNLTGLTEHKDYEKITISDGMQIPYMSNYLFWCTKSVFTFNINYGRWPSEIKIENECDFYRLCSPNGNGQFEFSLTKNGGFEFINVDCTYRPHDPYIHLNPNFGLLYGEDFNDFRGLVLNGDFSIPALNDAWIQYTIQNKNYQNIFNREIQSLELQNKIAYRQDILNAIVGTISGGFTFGGGVGLASKSLPGGLIAGGVGGLGSGIAGGFDVKYNRQLRQDQINLQKDLFSYNLQNIQAIPQSVSKTGCLTNNNKLVPYLEYYTCTEEEKQVLREKIKYQGMTVGATGLVTDYVTIGNGIEDPKYIEADIIEISLDIPYNITMEIANEMRGGVRFA